MKTKFIPSATAIATTGAAVSRPSYHPHFFQPLLPGFRTKLKIPEAFMRKHLDEELRKRREHESLPVVLTKDNREWVVHLRGRIIEKGWPEFIDQYYSCSDADDDDETKEMDVGDIIVFRHKGNFVFEVFVFDGSTSLEKPPNRHSSKKKNMIRNCKQYPNSKTKEKFECEDHISYPYFDIILRLPSLVRKAQYVPIKFVRENGLQRNCKMILKDKRGRSWDVDGKYYNKKSILYIGRGWNEFISGNDINSGDCLRFQLIKNGNKPIFLAAVIKKNNAADDDDDELNPKEKFECSRTHNDDIYPYVDVQLSNSRSDRQCIQRGFVRENGLERNCKMILKNELGMEWEVGATFYRKLSKFYISVGWNDFRIGNGIVETRERIRFHLIKNAKKPTLLLSRMKGKDLD